MLKTNVWRKYFEFGLADVMLSLQDNYIFRTLGWQDVATRYRRTRLGAFWLSLNMFVLIVVLGFVFGGIFRSNLTEFLPRLSIGIIIWGFLSSTLQESCDGFVHSRDTILEINMPYSFYVFRVLTRNIIIFFHNILIIPLIFLVLGVGIKLLSLLSLIGFVLIIINLAWISLFLAIISARFRDVSNIIVNLLQVIFYMTPIIWDQNMLPDWIQKSVLIYNPFFHALNVVRDPLLNNPAPGLSYYVLLLGAFLGWVSALFFLGKYKRRIAYWL